MGQFTYLRLILQTLHIYVIKDETREHYYYL